MGLLAPTDPQKIEAACQRSQFWSQSQKGTALNPKHSVCVSDNLYAVPLPKAVGSQAGRHKFMLNSDT